MCIFSMDNVLTSTAERCSLATRNGVFDPSHSSHALIRSSRLCKIGSDVIGSMYSVRSSRKSSYSVVVVVMWVSW